MATQANDGDRDNSCLGMKWPKYGDASQGQRQVPNGDDEDAELAQAIAASQAVDEDDQLARALAASLEDQSPADRRNPFRIGAAEDEASGSSSSSGVQLLSAPRGGGAEPQGRSRHEEVPQGGAGALQDDEPAGGGSSSSQVQRPQRNPEPAASGIGLDDGDVVVKEYERLLNGLEAALQGGEPEWIEAWYAELMQFWVKLREGPSEHLRSKLLSLESWPLERRQRLQEQVRQMGIADGQHNNNAEDANVFGSMSDTMRKSWEDAQAGARKSWTSVQQTLGSLWK